MIHNVMKKFNQKISEGILFTDQYQLTMAQLYFKLGLHEKVPQFDHFFRSYPDYGTHKAGYCINAGLEWLMEWMKDSHFTDDDLEYMRSQKSKTGKPIFDNDFLTWLKKNGSFHGLSMQAIPEGRVVHPNVPLTVVRGPMIMAQILETAPIPRIRRSKTIRNLLSGQNIALKIHGVGKLLTK